jgi:hypothetical protein
MVENKAVDRRWFFVMMAVAGLLLIGIIGTNMPPIGIDISNIQSLYASNFGGSDIPDIALNPPSEDDRQNLTDRLVEEGYKKEDIGIIADDSKDEKYEKDGYIKDGWSYDFLLSVDNLSGVIIPTSESVAIRNIEIVGKDGINFEIENLASRNISMPFITMNAIVLVENATPMDNPYQLEIEAKRIAWVEISEEEMAPGEVRKVITRDLAEKLEKGGHTLIKIKSVWIEIEKFYYG